jgi:hypothetical protein
VTDQGQRWPALPMDEWAATKDTVHRLSQMLGSASAQSASAAATTAGWDVADLRTRAAPRTSGGE